MADTAITLTCADYPRLMPLATGAVRPDGVTLKLLLGESGSWGRRAEMLSRAVSDPAVQGGEGSMARHLRRIEAGDRSHVALPAFPLRNLTARDIYVRRDGPVRTAEDLAGKRVGSYSWSASGSIWYRHLLQFLGVDANSFTWFVGNIDDGQWGVPEAGLPDGVTAIGPHQALGPMLEAGEIDALLSPPRPRLFDAAKGPIVRLLPDFKPVEQDYVRRFGVWPPQHLILLRRDTWLADRSLAVSITEAFKRSNQVFTSTQRSFPYASPWMEQDLDEADALLGPDAHADGLEPNRAAMEIFCEQAFRAGVTLRRVAVDDYFAEYLESGGA